MSTNEIPYIPATSWDIFKLNTGRLIGIKFDHEKPVSGSAFSGLTLSQTKQLISDLQLHVDYLDKLDEK